MPAAVLLGRWYFVTRTIIVACATTTIGFPTHGQECRDGQEARPKIVGGQAAQLRHWPGQAVLRLRAKRESTSMYFCGGSAINANWVLTAAHCVYDLTSSRTAPFDIEEGKTLVGELEVVLGVDDLGAVRDENVYRVEKVVVQEGYREAVTGNDIALLALKRPYNGPLHRFSLQSATDPRTPPGAQVRVAGFGSLKSGAGLNLYRTNDQTYFAGSQRLQETAVPTVTREECRGHYASQGATIDEGQICAGLEEGGRDSCQGDSGGPLFAYDRAGCPYQIGIVSWGVDCAGPRDYGVYTATSFHAAWISGHTGPLTAVLPADVDAAGAEVVTSAFIRQALAQLAEALPEADGRARIEVRGGNRIRLGDEAVFVVRSDVAGRLILVDIGAAGEVVQLLPNRYTHDHAAARIAAGNTLTVPSLGYGFTGFKAVEPVGRGTLIALVVPDSFPIDALAARKDQLAAGFAANPMPTNYLMNLVEQVVVAAADRSLTRKWALGIADYEIVR